MSAKISFKCGPTTIYAGELERLHCGNKKEQNIRVERHRGHRVTPIVPTELSQPPLCTSELSRKECFKIVLLVAGKREIVHPLLASAWNPVIRR